MNLSLAIIIPILFASATYLIGGVWPAILVLVGVFLLICFVVNYFRQVRDNQQVMLREIIEHLT